MCNTAKNSIKKTLARIAALALAGSFLVYAVPETATLSSLAGKNSNSINTVKAASASLGYRTTTASGSFSSSDGWGTNNSLMLKVYPASIDTACVRDTATLQHRMDYEKYALFIPICKGSGGSPANSNAKNHLKVFTNMDSAGNYSYTELDPGLVYSGTDTSNALNFTADTSNAFDNFLKCFKDNLSTITINSDNWGSYNSSVSNAVNAANNCLGTDSDAVYDAYIQVLEDTYGAEVKKTIENNLYNAPSAKFNGERQFTLIIEPMTDVTYSLDKLCYTSLYEYTKLVSTPSGYNPLFAHQIWAGRSNDRDRFSLVGNNSDGHPAYAATIVAPMLDAFTPVLDTSKMISSADVSAWNTVKDNHGGWTWFNIAGSNYKSPTTYSIIESAFLDPNSPADTLASMTYPNTNMSVREAINRRLLSNKDVTQKYYRRTTALSESDWKTNELVQVLDTSDDAIKSADDKYITVPYSADSENRKKDKNSNEYFLSVSPAANFEKAKFDSDPFKKQKLDYILSNDNKTASLSTAVSFNTAGCLNYDPIIKYDDFMSGALSKSVTAPDHIISGADFNLQHIYITVTGYDTSDKKNSYLGTLTWDLTDANANKKLANGNGTLDLTKLATKSTSNSFNNSLFASAVKLQDWFEQVKENSDRKYDGIHFTIDVLYAYDQTADATNPQDWGIVSTRTAKGSFETTIPEYCINTVYGSLLATENLKSDVGHENYFRSLTGNDDVYVLSDDDFGKLILPLGYSFKDQQNRLVTAPVLVEALGSVEGDKATYFVEKVDKAYLPTLLKGTKTRAAFSTTSISDTLLYNSFVLNPNKDNTTIALKNSYYYLKTLGNNVLNRFQSTENNALILDGAFVASKNAAVDKIVLADWVNSAEQINVSGYNNNNNRVGVKNSRIVDGQYNLQVDSFGLDGNLITKDISTRKVTDTKAASARVNVADSIYDTKCNIKNYSSKDNPNNGTPAYPGSPETSTTTKTDSSATVTVKGTPVSTVKFIPEVPMIYYPSVSTDDAHIVSVQSNKDREIKLVNYHTVDVDLNTTVSTTGMMPATDSRAGSLRNKFGTAGANASVLYGGSEVVNVVSNQDSALTFKSYVLDLDTGSKAVTSVSGAVDADKVASDWLNQYLKTESGKKVATVSVTGKNSVYSDWNSDTPVSTFDLESFDMKFESDGAEGYGTPTTYSLVVKDGIVVDILNGDGVSVPKSNDLWSVVNGMGLNDIFSKVLETTRSVQNSSTSVSVSTPAGQLFKKFYNNTETKLDQHWYGECTSIFKLKVYETTLKSNAQAQLTSKIPLNAGPTSVNSKNAFTNGYGVYVGFEAFLIGTDGKISAVTNKKNSSSKVTYIIPDQTVNDISH